MPPTILMSSTLLMKTYDLGLSNMMLHALFYSIVSLGLASSAPVLNSTSGILEGVDGVAPGSKQPYHVYYGIPYAMPPLGDLRYEEPIPFTPSHPDEVVTSDTYKPGCPQPTSFGNTLDENCLVMNVYTPGNISATSAPKKVMVFIHGGSFETGDTSIYPSADLVTDFDIIVVIIQYRLGVLGFLSSGTPALPGNYGLRDQIMALNWVKDNIHLFGGDADDVTLMGESAGSTSTSILSLSPYSKGLFTKVIMQSGMALSPWAIDLTSRKTFMMVATKAECVPENCLVQCDRKIVECLRTVEPMKMVGFVAEEAQVSEEDIFALDGYTSFAPVVDGDVIPRDPFDLIKDADYLREIGALDRKYMIAVDNNEALLFVYLSLAGEVVAENELRNPKDPVAKKIVRNNIQTVFPYPVTKSVVDFVTFVYYYPLDTSGLGDLQQISNMMSDIDFVVPAVNFARYLMAADPSVEVYLMLFDHYPPTFDPNFPLKGSTHGLELAYFFDQTGIIGSLMFYADVYAEQCLPMFDLYRGVMANMAKFGDPSLPGVVTWPRYDATNQTFLALSTTPEVRNQLYPTRVSLWADFLPTVLDVGISRGRGRAPF